MAFLDEEEVDEQPDKALSLSSLTGMLGRKPTEHKWKSTRKPERVELGPEEERALAAMSDEEPEEVCVDCGKPRSIGSGQRCRPCYLARAEAKRGAPLVDEAPETCGCGRPKNHPGRCSYRRQTSPSLADELAAEKRNGRPRIEVDLKKLEDAIANPALSMGEVAGHAGIKRNLIYDRKDVDPEFRAAYDRGMARREQALRSRISEDVITKPITSNGDGAVSDPADKISADPTIAENLDSSETPKHAMAKDRDIIRNLFQAISEKEAQITSLQDDIAALRRVTEILGI